MLAPPRRWSRVAGYATLTAAGVGAAAAPTPSVQDSSGDLVYLWAAFLIAGGLLSAYGAGTDRWLGEYSGLPLLFSAFTVYALILAARLRPASWAAAAALAGMALLAFARWRDVGLIRREATRHARGRR